MSILTVSVGQESQHRLSGVVCLRDSYKATDMVLAEAAVISGPNWGNLHFQAHSHGCCQDSVPYGL